MRRREDKRISKHTLNLYAGDYAKLQAYHGPRVGAAKIIRDVIHAYVRKIEENAAQKASIPLVDDLDVGVLDE